jgi:hypothetical protein
MHHELEAAYFSLRFESHPLEPFVKFMADLAKSDTKYCQLIVKIGFLDLFLNLYLDGFLVSSKAPFVPMPHRSSTLFDRCVEALMTIAADAVSSTSLHAHPIHLLWPRHAEVRITHCLARQIRDRVEGWKSLETDSIRRRLRGLKNLIEASCRHSDPYDGMSTLPVDFPSDHIVNTTTSIFDDIIDMVMFVRQVVSMFCRCSQLSCSRSDDYGEDIVREVSITLARYVCGPGSVPVVPALRGAKLKEKIRAYLSDQSQMCAALFESASSESLTPI